MALPACPLVAGPEKEQDAAGILAVFAEGCCVAIAKVLDAAEPAGNCGVTERPATHGGKLAVFPDVAQAAVFGVPLGPACRPGNSGGSNLEWVAKAAPETR